MSLRVTRLLTRLGRWLIRKIRQVHHTTRGVPEETHKVCYALHELGLCTAFVDHEWVSSRTIFELEEEILSMALDFKNFCPVRGAMEPVVVLCAHRLESHLGH